MENPKHSEVPAQDVVPGVSAHIHDGDVSPAQRKRRRFRITGAQVLLGLSLILFVVGTELLVNAYFPEASITKLITDKQKASSADSGGGSGSTQVFKEGEDYEGLNEPAEPLLTSVERGFGKPGEELVFENFTVTLSLDPARPTAGDPTEVIWTITDSAGKPVSEWDRSVHRTLSHTYLIRSDFQSRSFHLHPSVREDGTMTETVRFPTAGEWAITAQLTNDGVIYLLTSVFDIYNKNGTNEPMGEGAHTAEEIKITGARGIDFDRTIPLRQWDIEMVVEGGEPVRAGEPFTVEWIATAREGENESVPSGGTLDGGHNILMANITDPSLIWNTHGDRSAEPVSHLVGIPTYRWPTKENPFKYTFALPKPGIWWIHFEIQSSPIHFFIEVLKNPNAPSETLPIDTATVVGRRSPGFIDSIVDYLSGSE